jgi:hypothetical protein
MRINGIDKISQIFGSGKVDKVKRPVKAVTAINWNYHGRETIIV